MISDDWLIGFVEGEGCFSIGIQEYKDNKPRKTNHAKFRRKKPAMQFEVKPSFRIVLSNRDHTVLEAVKEKLGVGQIYIQKRQQYSKNWSNCSHYYVQTFSELLKVREFFQNAKFHSVKGENFKTWCLILDLMQEGKHLQKEGLLEICKLRVKMNLGESKTRRKLEEIINQIENPKEHILVHKEEKLGQTSFNIHNQSSAELCDEAKTG